MIPALLLAVALLSCHQGKSGRHGNYGVDSKIHYAHTSKQQ